MGSWLSPVLPATPKNQIVLITKSIVVLDWNNFKEKIGKTTRPRVLTGAVLIRKLNSAVKLAQF